MEQYENRSEGHLCACRRGLSTLHCRECFQYINSCAECFIERHIHQPLHWARYWQADKQFFAKYNYSEVLPGCAIHLGHNGLRCPSINGEISNRLTIVHTNGIHATKVNFCECPGSDERAIQLLRSRLFPASLANPKTTFTFETQRISDA